MKKLYLLFILFTISLNAQEPFITTWQIPENDLSFYTPIYGDDNNYTVDFGDGTVLTNQTQAVEHIYAAPGIYTVTFSGNIGRLSFPYETFSNLYFTILTVAQWGDIQWTSMEDAFKGCTNLTITATDTPDLSQVTSMKGMFSICFSLNQPLNDWDVSNITDMSEMFSLASTFNQPLDSWDVSNVTNMHGMFRLAHAFNQPIDSWDVSNVTDMSGMFNDAQVFNQPLNNWDVSNVTNMNEMFLTALTFNQPLDNWDVSNVTTMRQMFSYALEFDQPIENWKVGNVTDMYSMFSGTENFNQPLDNWDVDHVINMGAMFANALEFNQPLNSWDVSNVTTMAAMFFGSYNALPNGSSFNQPLDNWNVSGVTNMASMFSRNSSFNQPLNSWDVSNVTDMEGMFSDASNFNHDISGWNVGNVTDMSSMFLQAVNFNQPLESWNVANVTDMGAMFDNAISFNQPLDNWDVSGVTNMNGMFYNASSFNRPLGNWEVANVEFMQFMFDNASGFNQDISSWNFGSNVILDNMVSGSALDIQNYDALLLRFSNLELENKVFTANMLHYCDEDVHNYLIYGLGWTIEGDSLGTDCPSNRIFGNVIYDENANGCDTEDPKINNFLLNIDNGEIHYSTIPSEEEYNLHVMDNTYTVSLLNVPDYFTVSPPSSTVEFTSLGNEEEINFCLTGNEAINDLNIILLPLNESRPGFESNYRLAAENIGTQTITGATISFTYDSTKQSFVSSSEPPASATANQLTFDLGIIESLESKTIDIIMETFTAVNEGETINFITSVTPETNDYTPEDNVYNLGQTVTDSYVSNNKKVLQGDKIYMEQTDSYLDYIIEFQNTGLSSANTVKIKDIIHEKLDWTTFKPVSASHSYSVKITNGHMAEFIFNNINLPNEGADEEGSKGFVAYRIKPVQDIAVGNIITGAAQIFFDNHLIQTNSADTEVVEHLGLSQSQAAGFYIYPNPTKGVLHIRALQGQSIENITIYSLQGSEVMNIKGQQESINVQDLSAGIYLLNIQTNQGISQHRLIKK